MFVGPTKPGTPLAHGESRRPPAGSESSPKTWDLTDYGSHRLG
jgi:hypothetical protein